MWELRGGGEGPSPPLPPPYFFPVDRRAKKKKEEVTPILNYSNYSMQKMFPATGGLGIPLPPPPTDDNSCLRQQ